MGLFEPGAKKLSVCSAAVELGIKECRRLSACWKAQVEKATVNLRKGLRVVEEEEGKEKEQAAIEGLAEQVELVCGSRTHMNSLTVEHLPH